MAINLSSERGREAVKPSTSPKFQRLRPGLALGLRKFKDGSATWTARRVTGPQKYDRYFLGRFDATAFNFAEAREAAEAWAREAEGGARCRTEAGKVPDVEAACREYVESLRTESPSGAHDADTSFRRRVYGYVRPVGKKRPGPAHKPNDIARIPLAKFRERDLRQWRDAIVAGGASKGTANRNLTHLKAALNHAVKTRLGTGHAQLALEVALVVPYEDAVNRREIYLDREQRRALLAAAQHADKWAGGGALCDLIEASALTGARPGELRSLVRSDFDHRTETLSVSGKTGKRKVPLSPEAVAFFTRLGKLKTPAAPMLTRCDGKAWKTSDYDEHVREAVVRAGLPAGTVLMSLRHSWITEALLSTRMSTLEVARLVGTSVMMIEKHYGHLVANRSRENLAAVKML